MARRLAQAIGNDADKIVVLVDVDAKDPEKVVGPFENVFQSWQDWQRPIIVAYAQRHLEAWFFADAEGLRNYLKGKSPGLLDEDPDAMQNPKLRLINVLRPGHYTSRVAGEIAGSLVPARIAMRSRSFAKFIAAMRNGTEAAGPL